MDTSKRTVQFANFICHFGDLELLDLCEEVVIPAFTNKNLKRTYKETKYLFLDVELITVNEDGKDPEAVIAGRFIKDTVLEREQILSNGRLEKNKQQLPSAPSSLFILILRDHKLIFMPEMSGAPSLESFRSTTEKFLKHSHHEFISKLIEKIVEQKFPDGFTRLQKNLINNDVRKQYQYPILKIVSLTSRESLASFIERFEILKTLSIKLIKPNNEINNEGIFNGVREQGTQLNASATNVNYRNAMGLNKLHAMEFATSALDGNAEIDISGTDSEDRKLSGSNDDFKVQVKTNSIPKSIKLAAQKLFSIFVENKNNGIIRTGTTSVTPQKEVKLMELSKLFSGKHNGSS